MFSGAVGRERHCRQISLVCGGSTRSVLATLGLPLLTACVLSLSTLLRLQSCLQGVGPELLSLPRPKPLRCRFLGTPDSVGLAFCAFPTREAQTTRSLMSALSLGALSLIASSAEPHFPGALVRCALCLFWGADFWL